MKGKVRSVFKAFFSRFEFILKHRLAIKKGILVVSLLAANLLAEGNFAKIFHYSTAC